MTREKAILVLDSLSTWLGSERPITEEIVEAIKTLSHPSLPSNLDEAAHNYGVNNNACEEFDGELEKAFKAGAEWMAGQFVLVGGEPTGWFRANGGSEYATGLDLKEPIKLPVDFYVRKK